MTELFVLMILGGFFLLVVALCIMSWKSDVISEEDWREFCKKYGVGDDDEE